MNELALFVGIREGILTVCAAEIKGGVGMLCRLLVAALIISTLTGCYSGELFGSLNRGIYRDELRVTISQWERVLGAVGDTCRSVAENTPVVEVDRLGRMPTECHLSPSTVGCTWVLYDGNNVIDMYIFITVKSGSESVSWIVIHEYIHVLEICQVMNMKRGELGHGNKSLWKQYGLGTVESLSNAVLKQKQIGGN